jgi:predicted pyridoxine 5'-phosphate oxidase superfamily flavin-nucleotide-binding protein
MALRFAELMFTPAVKAEQERLGSRASYARVERPEAPARDRLGPAEAAFIAARDSFYVASVGETGWPYIQHRGGPPGFLKVLDDRTLGFADFRGNRQYVSLGNLKGDDRVALFLMDYPHRRRLKLLGHAREVDATTEPELLARLADPGYGATVERGIVITLEGFDWNCPQHITPRFTEAEVQAAAAPLLERLHAVEAERDALAARLEAAGLGFHPSEPAPPALTVA